MLVTGEDPHLVSANLLSQPSQFCHVGNLDLPHRHFGVLKVRREVVVARHDNVIEARGFDAPPEQRREQRRSSQADSGVDACPRA